MDLLRGADGRREVKAIFPAPDTVAGLSPTDAADRDVGVGDKVRVFNDVPWFVCAAKISPQ